MDSLEQPSYTEKAMVLYVCMVYMVSCAMVVFDIKHNPHATDQVRVYMQIVLMLLGAGILLFAVKVTFRRGKHMRKDVLHVKSS